MEWQITWGGDPEDVMVTVTGAVSVEGMDEWAQAVLSDPRYRPGLRILVDHRRASWHHLTADQLRRRADLIVRDAERVGHVWVARVITRPADFGLGRMLDAYLDERTGVTLRGFYDIDEARAWLRDPVR